MKSESCREWRESLGAYALGHLPEEERAAMAAHLEGCAPCREELDELESVARVMPLADPDRFADPALPPPGLGDRVVATIAAERRSTRRRRRFRLGLAFGGAAAAAAAAVLAIFVLAGGSGRVPEQHVSFAALPSGMRIDATLAPRGYGTEIQMYVEGVRSGTLCRVVLRGAGGARLSAGTFRYRYGAEGAVLSAALDLSRARTLIVHVGRRVFTASV